MDLPTYTNIWRIEKRLYKLYDFRLPAPLPITWIAVFTAITVPYVIFLIAVGLPFNHNLVWLYVLPPGVLTWLCTRPVIESKRLPELVTSQVRYVAEPRTWCRMASWCPLGCGTVIRRRPGPRRRRGPWQKPGRARLSCRWPGKSRPRPRCVRLRPGEPSRRFCRQRRQRRRRLRPRSRHRHPAQPPPRLRRRCRYRNGRRLDGRRNGPSRK